MYRIVMPYAIKDNRPQTIPYVSGKTEPLTGHFHPSVGSI